MGLIATLLMLGLGASCAAAKSYSPRARSWGRCWWRSQDRPDYKGAPPLDTP